MRFNQGTGVLFIFFTYFVCVIPFAIGFVFECVKLGFNGGRELYSEIMESEI